MERVKLEPFRPAPAAYSFRGYTLDPARGVLANPQGREAGLRPKSAEVLRYLAEKAGRVVSREELMQAVWPDIFVTDDNITQCVAEIRRSRGWRRRRRWSHLSPATLCLGHLARRGRQHPILNRTPSGAS
jgi:DNA-binding response OmpR family regulator